MTLLFRTIIKILFWRPDLIQDWMYIHAFTLFYKNIVLFYMLFFLTCFFFLVDSFSFSVILVLNGKKIYFIHVCRRNLHDFYNKESLGNYHGSCIPCSCSFLFLFTHLMCKKSVYIIDRDKETGILLYYFKQEEIPTIEY